MAETPVAKAANHAETPQDDGEPHVLKGRLLAVGSLTVPLRIAFVLAALQLVIGAILIASGGWVRWSVDLGLAGARASVVVMTFSIATLLIAEWCLLTGLMRTVWYWRWVGVVLFAISILIATNILRPWGILLGLPAILMVVCIAALVGFWNRRAGAAAARERRNPSSAITVLVLAAILLLVGIPVVLLASTPTLLSALFTELLQILWFPLVPALVWFGADYADIGEAVATSLVNVPGKRLPAWSMAAGAAAIAAASLTSVVAQRGIGGIGSAVEALAIGAIVVVLINRIGLSTDKRRLPPWPFVIAGVASVVALLEPLALLVLLAGALVLAGFARKRTSLVGPALYMIIVALLTLATYAPEGLLPFTVQWLPHLGLVGIQAGVALGTICWLVWLAARNAILAEADALLGSLVTLNIAIIGLRVIVDIFSRSIDAARSSTYLALLLLIAIGWELATSGELLNEGSRSWPRDVRVYLFVGYIILVTACVVFFATPVGGHLHSLESEGYTLFGVIILGSSLLVTHFLMKAARLPLALAKASSADRLA